MFPMTGRPVLRAAIVVGMHWSDLPNWLNGALVAATFAVVWFAWQTVKESRAATAAERETVAELRTLVEAARDTAASSASTLQAARETAEISRAAREADERHRQLEQLRGIHRLVVEILAEAQRVLATSVMNRPTWRCPEQAQLGAALVGVVPPLPKCRALAGESQVGPVKMAADAADVELREVFRSLGAEGG
jgi:hypothetical protein